MRICNAASIWQIILLLLFVAPSIVGDQQRIEQGHAVLDAVVAMHRLIDFGIEGLEPKQVDSFWLAEGLSHDSLNPGRKDSKSDDLGCDEWRLRSGMLRAEKLGRDLIAGKPISAEAAKIVDQRRHKDIDAERRADELNRTFHRSLAAKLIAGQSLDDDEFVMQCQSFRSGAQFSWHVPDLTFDVALMLKAYPSAPPKSQHAMLMLLGLRGKADELCIGFMLDCLKATAPIERYDAAIAIGQMQSKADRLVSALINLVDDPDPRVARAATRSLLVLDAEKSAPAMLRRLKSIIDVQATAAVSKKADRGFDEYEIRDGQSGVRYDLPTELMVALGRFRHRQAAPLLWEIVNGRGKDVWPHDGIYEMDHGGVAVEAIAALDAQQVSIAARRVLALDSATVDAVGAAANLLGPCGELSDVPVLLKRLAKFDAVARGTELRFDMQRAVSRIAFAAERLVFFGDKSAPKYSASKRQLIATLGDCASGPFGEPLIAALEYFDPEHVEATALILAADTKAEPNARRIAIEILAKSRNPHYINPLSALISDRGNATNGSIGLHAGQAVVKILAAADLTDAQAAECVRRVGDNLEASDFSAIFCGFKFR